MYRRNALEIRPAAWAGALLGALALGCGGSGSPGTASDRGSGSTTTTTPTAGSGPELSAWKRNTTGLTGYGGQAADVQRVQYSDAYVYPQASGIPDYTIGPWPGNPNTAQAQGFVFKIPRHPAAGPGTATPLGPIGAWVNGVVMYNAKDAHSWNDQGVWHQDAVVVEAGSFDAAKGHPDQLGRYHHHQNPIRLYTDDAAAHAPLLGFAYDGYPVYGPRGFANADGSGGVVRMTSSYRLRSIAQRHTLPDGTVLSASQYGPDVSATYPLGYYVEDYEYVPGLGTLDAHNGRFAVTPEYPAGTYAYYVTVDAGGASAYPYIVGPTYYGAVAQENLQTGGHVSITETVATY